MCRIGGRLSSGNVQYSDFPTALQYLIQLGHKSIACITGALHLPNAQERLAGYRRGLKLAGLPFLENYVRKSTFDRVGGYNDALALLRLRNRPTAIFAQNDLMAQGYLTGHS